jgi:hypothetical protein
VASVCSSIREFVISGVGPLGSLTWHSFNHYEDPSVTPCGLVVIK